MIKAKATGLPLEPPDPSENTVKRHSASDTQTMKTTRTSTQKLTNDPGFKKNPYRKKFPNHPIRVNQLQIFN